MRLSDDHYEAVVLPKHWQRVEVLDPGYSLVFRHNHDLMVFDCGDPRPRRVPTSPAPGFFGTPSWSADGTLMFDCETQVISLDTDTGKLRALTAFNVSKGGLFRPAKGWPDTLVASVSSRFVHDQRTDRLYFVVYPDCALVFVDLTNLSVKRVVTERDIGGRFLSWALSGDRSRWYTALAPPGGKIVSVPLDGGKKTEISTRPLDVGELLLSPDGDTLLAEMFAKHDRDYVFGLGCRLLDASSLELKHEIPRGHSFRWSTRGDRIAFLMRSEELWVYDVNAETLTKLVYVMPLDHAPDWSHRRYFAYPAWSRDDRMLACGMAIWAGPGYHDFDFFTIILDLKEQQVLVVPEYWQYLSWSPIARPFCARSAQEGQKRGQACSLQNIVPTTRALARG